MWITATHPLAQRLAVTMSGIIAVLGAHSVWAGALSPLFALVHRHLVHLVRRLDRLAQLWQMGRLPAPRPSRAGRARAATPPSLRLPDCPAWLIQLAQPTAQFSGQIQAILDDPHTSALVQAAPQAGRILRPLCRMLGLPPPDWLRRPGDPAQPTHRSPARPRPSLLARYRAKLDPPRPPGPNFLASHVFRT